MRVFFFFAVSNRHPEISVASVVSCALERSFQQQQQQRAVKCMLHCAPPNPCGIEVFDDIYVPL